MHEYSIVQAMFDQIEARAGERQALSVRRVRVRIGRAAGVDVDLLRTAFDVYKVRTLCESAPLEVEEVAERWACPSGHGDITPGRRLVCETCGRPAHLAAGDDIVLEQLELEVA
jgi:hydrogenase nickel incorporation protein HypA/HybF